MAHDNVLISLISALSGIVVTYITVHYRNQSIRPKAKNRIDVALDAYERIIKQQQQEIDRLRKEES